MTPPPPTVAPEEGGIEMTERNVPMERISIASTVDIPEGSHTRMSWNKLFAFLGPAFMVSVGFMDPGNWATDIESGSRFKYQLLWVLVLSNFMAILLQNLAARMGVVTRLNLAEACREEYPPFVCYTLWGLCEIAIAATDLAEVLGTAIGLHLLFKMPMLLGVLLTAGDTFLFLLIQNFGIRKLEAIIMLLLGIIGMCFVVEIFLVRPSVPEVLSGLTPIITAESLYVGISMVGATVMPHNFYLHSAIVQSRLVERSVASVRDANFYNLIDSAVALNCALFVNMSILIVSAAVFYGTEDAPVETLGEAHDLLEKIISSKAAPAAFGVALIAAGQSSTLTGTLAGQFVMEGFLHMRMRPWLRRLVTRAMAIVPAVVAIVLAGDEGTYKLLILSQVVLSMQLPFAIVPLIKITSDERKMGIFRNSTTVRTLAWACATLIISLNLWLVVDTLRDWVGFETPLQVAVTMIVTPCAVALVGLLGWMCFYNSHTASSRYISLQAPPLARTH